MNATPTIATGEPDPLTAFHWTPQPAAEALVKEMIGAFLAQNAFAARLAVRMTDETGTRFIDWVDHIGWPDSSAMVSRLLAAGFVRKGEAYVQEGGIFPRIILRDQDTKAVAIKVESVLDFASANRLDGREIEGSPLAPLRRMKVATENQTELWALERHGFDGFDPPDWPAQDAWAVLKHSDAFRQRRRLFEDENEGIALAGSLIDAAVAELGASYAADLFFAAEREYWQRRNRAAQVQKARQDRLGLGWANHDHHTYRSSRQHFAPMIALFEKLGLVCRERFYAGADAGWGAQVMEHPQAGFVVFADVDLSPEELRGDFSHMGLESRRELGTVGLWCGLHGEAILQAGMHHLECQFDFDALKGQLEQEEQVKVMNPFTNFPYLRQAFTEGEIWPVAENRLVQLLQKGQITAAQAEQFSKQGALGSHLENLERNEGFKGFNQTGVSDIIARTDPRKAAK